MDKLLARIIVILRAAPTYLVAAALVLGIIADELPEIAGIPPAVLTLLARIITVIGVAVTIIRRVTPVVEDARGILPPAELPPAEWPAPPAPPAG